MSCYRLLKHVYSLTIIIAALEVYVRRSYCAYTVNYIDYAEGDGLDDGEAPNIVTWQFKLSQSRSPPSTPSLMTFG